MSVQNVVKAMREMGFKWEVGSIGVKFERGLWNVNVMLLNDDGSKNQVYGFLGFESVDDAVQAKVEMSK